MSPSRRRALWLALLMAAGAGTARLARPGRHLADSVGVPDLEALFPARFAEWRTDPGATLILPSPDVQAVLDRIYNQTISRSYANARGERVMLVAAFGGDQSDGTSVHRPEVCYPALGFAVSAHRAAILPLDDRALPVRQLVARLDARREPVTYWIVVGGQVVTTGIGQKLAQMRHGLRGVIADGLLVRVSSLDADADAAYALQRRFVGELHAHLTPAQRERVFGDGAPPPGD